MYSRIKKIMSNQNTDSLDNGLDGWPLTADDHFNMMISSNTHWILIAVDVILNHFLIDCTSQKSYFTQYCRGRGVVVPFKTFKLVWLWKNNVTYTVNFRLQLHLSYFIYITSILSCRCSQMLGRSLMIGWRKKSWNPERVPSVVTLSLCLCACLCVCKQATGHNLT